MTSSRAQTFALVAAAAAAGSAIATNLHAGRGFGPSRVALGALGVAIGLSALSAWDPDLGASMAALVTLGAVWAFPWGLIPAVLS